MTFSLPVGPLTPYVTPSLLVAAPTGIAWSTIPSGTNVTAAQHTAEQLNICMRATSQVEEYCNQVLRATLDTEILSGPNYRVTIQKTGNTRVILERWPVTDVVSVEVSPNSFPRSWVTVPSGYYEPEYPPVGIYGTSAPSASADGGQAMILSAGYVDWALGRDGYRIKTQYVNGWPHTSLTATTAAGVTTIQVDDCTGWAPFSTGGDGATGVIYDSGSQEVVHVTASSATSGPGTLTLAGATQFAHLSGTLVTSLPASVMWATILMAASEALTRGATSTTVHNIPGTGQSSRSLLGTGPAGLSKQACDILAPFRRVI